MTEDRLMFVQFPHPGREHEPDGDVMRWNGRDHKRKFLEASATYIDTEGLHTGPVSFWGEWEPPSRVIARYRPTQPGLPHYLHEPFWEVPRKGPWQNTDPLVFGDRFLYSNCRQERNEKLRSLAPGSIILFGSKLGGEFVLDTLFVVAAGSARYEVAGSRTLDVEPWVQEVVFERLRQSAKQPQIPLRLYRSVTFQELPDGPFSFVPCQPASHSSAGFARPPIRLDRGWISPGLALGAKATPASPAELRELWNSVVGQVMGAGLELAVGLGVPARST